MSAQTDWRAPLEGLIIPRHIAVVMDGNGRWAKQRGLPRLQGHYEGRKATKRFVLACLDIGVEVVSTYAFSQENWKRPPDEVQGLMMLLEIAIRDEAQELHEKGIRFQASGRLDDLPEGLKQSIADSTALTQDNRAMTLNVLINYGGRAEIVDAARRLARRAAEGDLNPADLDEDTFNSALYAPDLPDPDMVYRPGGEFRYSNFLLWEIAYTELIVAPVLWPDIQRTHVVEAVLEFNSRRRRFGGVDTAGES